MINWAILGIQLAKTLGGVLLSIGMQLLAGKAFKKLLLLPFQKWASRTKNTTDDKLVEQASRDLGLDPDNMKGN